MACALRLGVLALAFTACGHACAAADDLNATAAPDLPEPAVLAATPAPTSKPKSGIAAAARRLIDDVIQTPRAVVEVLRDNVVSRVMASSWRVGVGAPFVTRATSLVSAAPLPSMGGAAQDPAAAGLDNPLGARWRVVRGDADTHVPAVSWMPDSQIAATSALRPSMHLSGEWALPNDFSLGVMPGMAMDTSPQGRRQATGTLAVTLGKAWSPQWRTFVDMARDRLDTMQIAGTSTSVDAGLSFSASASTQIDFALTRGISDSSTPFQAGVGVSSRF